MKISIETSCCVGGCLVFGALNAYTNPVRWITTFVLGVLAGFWLSKLAVSDVLRHQTIIDAGEVDKKQKGLEDARIAAKAGATPGQIANKMFASQKAATPAEIMATFSRTSPEDKRNNALDELILTSIPGKGMTIFHLLASGMNWMPKIDACAAFCKRIPPHFEELSFMANLIPSFALGFQVGASIQLGRLWFNPNPGLQKKLKAVVL